MSVKTTLYLPSDLKRAIEAEAGRRGTSEAEIIRDSLRHSLGSQSVKPRGALFGGEEPVADRVDELLVGFGET